MRPLIILSGVFLTVAGGQTSAPVSFDVATIKQAPPFDQAKMMSGQARMGAKIDGARAEYNMMSMQELICKAYDIKPHQLAGPDWMKATRWDIQATIPEGAGKDQVNAMLQALLKERFKLEIHKDTREVNIYSLVQAKSGAKLKPAEPDVPAPPAEGAEAPKEEAASKDTKGSSPGLTVNGERLTMKQTGNGMTVRGGEMGQVKVTMNNGLIHMEYAKMTMAKLAETLTPMVDRPVNDDTQLKGNYQVALDLAMADVMALARKVGVNPVGPGGPPGAPVGGTRPADSAADPGSSSIFTAVEQMGLKLTPRKGPVEMVVVDHIEKTPTEN